MSELSDVKLEKYKLIDQLQVCMMKLEMREEELIKLEAKIERVLIYNENNLKNHHLYEILIK